MKDTKKFTKPAKNAGGGVLNNPQKVRKAFSLVELVIAILIIAVLVAAVFAGGSIIIKNVQISRTTSDLHNFSIAVESWMNQNPTIANVRDNASYKTDTPLYNSFNALLAEDYKLEDAVGTSNITITQDTEDPGSYYIAQSKKTDAWGNPYYVVFSNQDRRSLSGDNHSEFYVEVISAGPNAKTKIGGTEDAIDRDDIFIVGQYDNSDVVSYIYNYDNVQPGNHEATRAISFLIPDTAPTNIGAVRFTSLLTGNSTSASSEEPANTEDSDFNIDWPIGNTPAPSETYIYSQTNGIVQKYLDEVTYNPNDYSYSSISNYTSISTPYDKSKPLGYTIDLPAGILTVTDNGTGLSYEEVIEEGPYTFYNITPGVGGEFVVRNVAGSVLQQGHLRPTGSLRMINSNTKNVRDLGGWSCDGGTIKYGILYRSAALNSGDRDLFINKLGIKTEIDLTASLNATSAYGDEMDYVCADSYAMYALTPSSALKTNLQAVFDAAKNGNPAIFHCSMGADRTGTFACIVEGLLGVSQSDLDKDYELTSFYSERRRDTDYQGGGGAKWERLINQINALDGVSFRDKCVTFAISLGFTVDEINDFRTAMIDGTPEPITVGGVDTINNQIAISTDIDGTIYNTTGYKAGYRINSSGTEVAATGMGITGFIPFSLGDTIRVKQFITSSGTDSFVGYFFFKADHTIIGRAVQYSKDKYTDGAFTVNGISTWTPNASEYNAATGAQMDLTNAAYIRMCIGTDNNPPTGWVVTINEQINETPLPVVPDNNSEPNYTNLADPSSEEWLTNQRITTSSYAAYTGADVTNWIPCSYGDTLYVKGLKIDATVYSHARWAFADVNKSRLIYDINGFRELYNTGNIGNYDSTTGVYSFPVGKYYNGGIKSYTDIAYIRLCGTYSSGDSSTDVIITVNEPIE